MKVEFINPFIVSLKNVVSTMAHIQLDSHRPQKKTDSNARGDVSGIIGMIGPQVKGSMAITFEKELAFNIMHKMMHVEVNKIDDDMLDMVGEMTNMICGGAKNLLAEQSYQFDIATPVIMSGPGHLITHKVDGPKILLSFTSTDGNAYLEICFDS